MTVGNTKIKESMLNLRPITLNLRLFTTSKRLLLFWKSSKLLQHPFFGFGLLFFFRMDKKSNKEIEQHQ
jgi:hypothetical protein